MDIPTCPACGSEDLDVLHMAQEAGPATLQCADCQKVFRTNIEKERDRDVRCIISEGPESEKETLPLPIGEDLVVDGEIFHEGSRYLITGLEDQEGKRQKRLPVDEVGTVWLIPFDTVTVSVSLNVGEHTMAREITVTPEHVFTCGQEMLIGGKPALVKSIKTKTRSLWRGEAMARDIIRVYGEPVRSHKERERRTGGRGGSHGGGRGGGRSSGGRGGGPRGRGPGRQGDRTKRFSR